ncbi:MAG: hypothetical protein QW356_03900 [Candidatus Hadarchaeales archaeon]
MTKKLTVEALGLLRTLSELAKTSEFGVVRPKVLAKALDKSYGATVKMLHDLKRRGYVDNPVFAGWTPTSKGERALRRRK